MFVRDPLYKHAKDLVECKNDNDYLKPMILVLGLSLGAMAVNVLVYIELYNSRNISTYDFLIANLLKLTLEN